MTSEPISHNTADDGSRQQRQSTASALLSLVTSSGTLVCCAMPALLVTFGAGAVLSSVVSTIPQLVWLSEHSGWVFGVSATALALAGMLQWRNRSAPCPVDAQLRSACMHTRRLSLRVYLLSVAVFAVGGWFAFVQPLL